MFKIESKKIKVSRGDCGTITLKIPITDVNNYMKCTYNSTDYWYDSTNNKVYDTNYNIVSISPTLLTIVYYQFQDGDVITFNVYEKNGYDQDPLLSKEINATALEYSVDIPLTAEDTTFGDQINKDTTFWYDITLNEDMTILGYDDIDGAKEFIMYPAKGDNE